MTTSRLGRGPAKRIVLTTWGSYGDLFPVLALGRGLHDRGHDVTVAAPEFYREIVTGLQLAFRPMRPDLPAIHESEAVFRRMMDPRRGTERVVCESVLPSLPAMYEDLSEISAGADLIGTSLLALAGRLVAEQQGIPWCSIVLQPSVFLSTSDPPVFGVIPGMERLRPLPPVAHRFMHHGMTLVADRWVKPWHAFRRQIGLPPDPANPLLSGQFSSDLVLALFSAAFATPQPDWPADAVITGFPFSDDVGNEPLTAELEAFLDEGEPPIVFTLGTSAVFAPGAFYEESIMAARALGRRAVLLSGFNLPDGIVHRDPDMLAVTYASHARLFPRAAAVVHQLGVHVPQRGADGVHVESERRVEVGDAGEGDEPGAVVAGAGEEAVEGVGGGEPAGGADVGGQHGPGRVHGDEVGKALELGLFVAPEEQGTGQREEKEAGGGGNQQDVPAAPDGDVAGVRPAPTAAGERLEPTLAPGPRCAEEPSQPEGNEGRGNHQPRVAKLHGRRLRRTSCASTEPSRSSRAAPAGHGYNSRHATYRFWMSSRFSSWSMRL